MPVTKTEAVKNFLGPPTPTPTSPPDDTILGFPARPSFAPAVVAVSGRVTIGRTVVAPHRRRKGHAPPARCDAATLGPGDELLEPSVHGPGDLRTGGASPKFATADGDRRDIFGKHDFEDRGDSTQWNTDSSAVPASWCLS